MDLIPHRLSSLFSQLGLPTSRQQIDEFIIAHPLSAALELPDASYWNLAQASFLRQCLDNDSDWCEAADSLAVRLTPCRAAHAHLERRP
jgi:hypothetical protein